MTRLVQGSGRLAPSITVVAFGQLGRHKRVAERVVELGRLSDRLEHCLLAMALLVEHRAFWQLMRQVDSSRKVSSLPSCAGYQPSFPCR